MPAAPPASENCVVTVCLDYTRDGFQGLLDGELDRFSSGFDDGVRQPEAEITDNMVDRSEWKIALEPVRSRRRERPARQQADLRRGLRPIQDSMIKPYE